MGSIGTQLIAVGLIYLISGAADAACTPGAVDLRGPSGVQRFHIEVADDQAEQAKGLMFREKLATSAGMLFVFPQPKHAVFWMKNTILPLDMIFADSAGRVTSVHSNAVPQDETPIDGGPGVALVLEINAGLAKRMGITEGSEIRHPAIAQSAAAWPCNSE